MATVGSVVSILNLPLKSEMCVFGCLFGVAICKLYYSVVVVLVLVVVLDDVDVELDVLVVLVDVLVDVDVEVDVLVVGVVPKAIPAYLRPSNRIKLLFVVS